VKRALNQRRKERPDLVLLDMNMPGMGGLEACKEIRRSSDAPIIMLTVCNAERDKVMALDAGADDYVVKPFGIEELLARIRSALRRYAPGDAVAAVRLQRCEHRFREPPGNGARGATYT